MQGAHKTTAGIEASVS